MKPIRSKKLITREVGHCHDHHYQTIKNNLEVNDLSHDHSLSQVIITFLQRLCKVHLEKTKDGRKKIGLRFGVRRGFVEGSSTSAVAVSLKLTLFSRSKIELRLKLENKNGGG